MTPSARLHFIADFNIEPLVRYMAHTALPGVETSVAPFGAVVPSLAAGPPGPDWSAVVWARPEGIIDGFRRALALDLVDPAIALEEVRAYAAAVIDFSRRARAVFIPTWTTPPFERGLGMLDWRMGTGVAELLARMNVALADALHDQPSVFVLDAGRWIASAGARGWSQKSWYAAKSPFGPAIIEQAAADITAAIEGLAGRGRRVVILDLDDVLWGGLVGETGWSGVTLGGHDHIGEAFVDFQRALKVLTRRGVQLAIASKNDEGAALEAIERHPEMQLRRDDFAAWRINWRDKAQNVEELLQELNLGAESAVFIDDTAIERARIRDAVPGILVPDWPADPSRFRETLASLRCFDGPFVTAEDRARTGMFAAERSRRTVLAAASTVENWLKTLGIHVVVEPLTTANLERAAQLFNKTNQMTVATRRLTKGELEAWASAAGHMMLTFRVSDRFGDSGLTGMVGLRFDGGVAHVIDFLWSCRVAGRTVEDAMLHVAVAHSRARGASTLRVEIDPTPRNKPCVEFFERSGLRRLEENVFVWDAAQPYGIPPWVTLSDEAKAATAIDSR